MRRLSFGGLLILLNAGLVLVAVVWVAAGAVRVLRQLADRQALARVDLAAQSAAAVIARAGDEVAASARLAADHPVLGRLVAGGGGGQGGGDGDGGGGHGGGAGGGTGDGAGAASAAPAAWLERFRRTSELSGCALFAGGRLLASAGPALPWAALRRPGGGRTMVPGDGGVLLLGGTAPLAAAPRVEAVTALALDGAFARRAGAQVGLPVAVLGRAEAERASATAVAVRERALARPPLGLAAPAALAAAAPAVQGSGAETAATAATAATVATPGAAARVDVAELYIADRPLFAPGGEVMGVVETRLPTATVDRPLASLTRRLLVLALVVAALATLASAAAGRWLGRPVRQLTASAARLGRGDLTTPIERAPGRELGALAATLEETRRQLLRLTAELRRRQAEGEAVLTGIAEGVLSVDRDRRIRYLNPQAAALLGVDAGGALGRFCGDVLDPRGADGERPCADGCPIVHSRFRGVARATEHLQLAGGRRRSVVITSAGPVEERQFLVLRDETDVEVARRQRDTVLANISHEFKTPLAAQRASIELLRDKLLEGPGGGSPGVAGSPPGAAPPVAAGALGAAGAAGAAGEEVHELVLSLERGGLRLTQLIDNLLESVRIESGQDSVRRRPVALDEVIEEAAGLTAPLFAQRRQRVAIELPYPLPAIEGDAPRLVQVFVNLLANAHKFAPAGSALAIGGEVTAREVALWVDDEGPGLPATTDAGRELFRRFVRSPEERGEPEQSGMGLGLWIVQSIVERHGGTVEAERRAPGTRMRITLPRPPLGDEGERG